MIAKLRSLRAIPEALRGGAEAVFDLFAIFPEDAIVPVAVIDVVLPLRGPRETDSRYPEISRKSVAGNSCPCTLRNRLSRFCL